MAMTWRSVVISKPGYLKLQAGALTVDQAGDEIRVPLEDISVILLDNPQITLTAPLLSACAAQKITLLTTGDDHHPNGIFLPYLPHSRAVQVLRLQLQQSQPRKKRLWQTLVQQKITNQAACLRRHDGSSEVARKLERMAAQVKSGDSTRQEALAAQFYFVALFGHQFARGQTNRINAMLNYGYAVIRAALARSLVCYGFLPALGLHHDSERNAFNLADDLIEPFRPLLDSYCLTFLDDDQEADLRPQDKVRLVGFLHEDVTTVDANGELTQRSVLAACEAIVISLQQRLRDAANELHVPVLVV